MASYLGSLIFKQKRCPSLFALEYKDTLVGQDNAQEFPQRPRQNGMARSRVHISDKKNTFPGFFSWDTLLGSITSSRRWQLWSQISPVVCSFTRIKLKFPIRDKCCHLCCLNVWWSLLGNHVMNVSLLLAKNKYFDTKEICWLLKVIRCQGIKTSGSKNRVD